MSVKTYSVKKDGKKQLTKNFVVSEFACKDGTDKVLIAEKLPMVLQFIRARVNRSVTINSAYRTEKHNKSVGGASNSQHLLGYAADIKVVGYKPQTLANIAREIMPDWGGVGIYDWGIHVDVRDSKSDWRG